MNNRLDFWRGGISNPLRELTHFQRVMDRLFDDWAGARIKNEAVPTAFNPTCEVSETKDAYQLRFDLPGIPKEQIKIELNDNVLTVSGERKEEKKETDPKEDEQGGKRRHFTEIYYGSFMRSFSFPTAVDAEKVEAKYDNGVLAIQVQKTGQSKARQVTIK